MKRMVLVVGMVVCLAQTPAQAGLLGTAWNGLGGFVATALTVTHGALHIVEDMASGLMVIVHSAMDTLAIPWEPRAEEEGHSHE